MTANLNDILQIHRHEFHAVVPFDPSADKLLPFDFTENNKELNDELLNDTYKFSDYISGKIKQAGARYGIGGYAEHRTVYSRSRVFDAKTPGEEPRRFHLGIDIWGPVNTPVMAPMDGVVHSFSSKNDFGDYGTVIILSHKLQETSFYTLYGHLSNNSIKNIDEGHRIRQGEVFAEFGMQFENGHWPPHLHFQVMLDLEDHTGDYPGVCKFSEKEKYLVNCPDPDLILQLNRFI